MYKKTVKYVDYNGVERVEDCYFNLNKVECTQLQLSTKKGYGEYIKEIIDSKDMGAIFNVFNEIILKSYGKKDPDGRRFIKSEELSKEFSQTEAFVTLFMDIAQNPNSAEEFIAGVFPAELIAKQ